jgi:hypothetical protein
LEYVYDLPNGGCMVECGFCRAHFNCEAHEVCPECGENLIFPRCDW